MLAKQDGGRRFEYTAKTGHFEKSLHLPRTLDARCPNAKFVHKNSLSFMEIIIFQLMSCLYFYDSGIEVPVCIRKPSRSTVYQPVASYTVPSINSLLAPALIYRAISQQTPGSVGKLRKVGRPSPGVQRVNITNCIGQHAIPQRITQKQNTLTFLATWVRTWPI